MARERRKSLEDSLIEKGLIKKEDIDKAIKESQKSGQHLVDVLVKDGLISDEVLAKHFSDQLSLPKMSLAKYLVDEEVIKLVPESMCRENEVLPLFKLDNTVTVAMANPLDIRAIDKVHAKTKCIVEPVVSTAKEINSAIDSNYKKEARSSLADSVGDLGKKVKVPKDLASLAEIKAIEKTPIVRAVNQIIGQAVVDKASDIHIEPDGNILRVRYRVDGILNEMLQLPIHLQSSILTRIKVLSGMNIAEKRLPQDGSIEFHAEKQAVDLRVATYPTVLGEKAAIRILYKSENIYTLTQLGFLPEMLKQFDELIERPHGIILVTGPTGSGKSTTLYAALSKINTLEKNILTVEDPVEYHLNIVNQSQVNVKAGWTFASGMKSIVRQDPDIIMIGEIRDIETARMAMQASLTGHLVFSTLHTNDAPSTATRLIDMGVEPFLTASTLIGALAQRLVRLLCPKCKEEYKPEIYELERLHIEGKKGEFYKAKGCQSCNNTGYKGRIGIFELMLPNEEIRALIVQNAATSIIKDAAKKAGMLTLRESGISLVLEGKTSADELFRVTQDEEL